MAGRIGTFLAAQSFIYGDYNPNLSAELNELTAAEYTPTIYDPRDMFLRGGYSAYKIAPSNRWPIVGKEPGNFGAIITIAFTFRRWSWTCKRSRRRKRANSTFGTHGPTVRRILTTFW